MSGNLIFEDHLFDDDDEERCDYCGSPLDECACLDFALGPDGQWHGFMTAHYRRKR